MNEESNCITNEGKTAKIEWENDDSDFLQALYSAYKNLFLYLLVNLVKERYIRSVKSYKYLNKLLS